MEFELDLAGKTAESEQYYVYIQANGKKRCIGQVAYAWQTGLWSCCARGERLASAVTAEEAVQKLWMFENARKGEAARKPIAECTVEERFARLRKRIPREAHFTEATVREARKVPLERRLLLLEDIEELIEDLETQLYWWRKIRREIGAAPKLIRYK